MRDSAQGARHGLQLLTTEEPDRDQLAVAIVALKEALGPDSGYEIKTGDYRLL